MAMYEAPGILLKFSFQHFQARVAKVRLYAQEVIILSYAIRSC
jgi:hypothetical protein